MVYLGNSTVVRTGLGARGKVATSAGAPVHAYSPLTAALQEPAIIHVMTCDKSSGSRAIARSGCATVANGPNRRHSPVHMECKCSYAEAGCAQPVA